MCSEGNNSYSLNKSLQLCEESNPEGEQELCSDKIMRRFPTFDIDDEGKFWPGSDAETSNFNIMKAVLLS